MDKHIRLENFVTNKDALDNIICLYKKLRGKENLELRLFLKTFVYASITKCKIEPTLGWLTPNEMFGNLNYFDDSYLKRRFKMNESVYGLKVSEIFGKLL